jgi:hypothetical protein
VKEEGEEGKKERERKRDEGVRTKRRKSECRRGLKSRMKNE